MNNCWHECSHIYIGLLIQNFISFIIISNIISVSFSGWKNMSLGKLGWGVMGAIGQARDGNWFITIAFCFPSIHICLGRKLRFADLCVWIYLVWWAIITCGRKYQLSEADSHMDQTPSSTPDRTHLSDFLFHNLQR